MKKKKVNGSTNLDANNGEMQKKERHIVSWTQEEDDILREQIRLHGTENWAVIASKFKDKTTRQCRRRWFTYLNSDFKKGGWSPEEDVLLCEAQKMYGNRWTEIAKVVSGRTDNAVKNRFTTLCKKRAKCEALAKENSNTSYINLSNKRVIFRNGLDSDGGSETAAKKIRTYTSSIGDDGSIVRHPFAVISVSEQSCEVNFPTRMHIDEIKEASSDGSMDNNIQTSFIKTDDPKVIVLMQQAELLSSLAMRVSANKTVHNGSTDLRRCNEGIRSSWRERDVLYESSPGSSEYSTGSTLLSTMHKREKYEAEILIFQTEQIENQHCLAVKNGICHIASTNEVTNELTCDDIKPDNGGVCESEFSSPIHVTPMFRALAAAIPSPKFSESEKHFLMKTLGMESTSPSPVADSLQSPPCKRSLLHHL